MANIRELKNKQGKITSFEITVSLGYDENGKKLRKRITYHPEATTAAKARKEVERYAAQYETEVLSGAVIADRDNLRFRDFVDVWDKQLLEVRARSGDITQRCREDYIRSLTRFGLPAIGHIKMSAINAVHIDAIVNDMIMKGYAAKTIRNVFNAFRAIFDYAYRKNIIRENPCGRCNPLPKIKKSGELHCFDENQVQRFLYDALTKVYDIPIKGSVRKYSEEYGTGEEFEVRPYIEHKKVSLMFRTFFTLAVFGGFRRGELTALKWNDIDNEARTIRIDEAITMSDKDGQTTKDPKTAAGARTIKLPQECFDLLSEWKREQIKMCIELGSAWEGKRGKEFNDNYIFIQRTGSRMNVQTPSAKFREILVRYNESVPDPEKLPLIRLHDLRHTNATHLIANGTDIETVSRRLGHSKPSFTLDVYGHALESKDDKASDMLEGLFSKKA